MFFKRNNDKKLSKESLLKLLVEQQDLIEKQAEEIKTLKHHIEIMNRLSTKNNSFPIEVSNHG